MDFEGAGGARGRGGGGEATVFFPPFPLLKFASSLELSLYCTTTSKSSLNFRATDGC
jgi:hypothetical protein